MEELAREISDEQTRFEQAEADRAHFEAELSFLQDYLTAAKSNIERWENLAAMRLLQFPRHHKPNSHTSTLS